MDKLPRDETGCPGHEKTKYARRVIRRRPWLSLALFSTLAAAQTVNAAPARFWLSMSSTSPTNAPIAPEISVVNGITQYVYIWGRPETYTGGSFQTMQNFSLNLTTSNPVVDFLDDQVFVYNRNRYRFQYVGDSSSNPAISEASEEYILEDNAPDSIQGIQGFSFNTYSYNGFGGQSCSTFYDCLTSPNGTPTWLIARVGFRPVRDGTTDFHLQIGVNGMNHFDESSLQTLVSFGTDTASSSTYNASTQREHTDSGDTPDLILHVSAATALPGDYNRNNKVDAADYVVWRKDPANNGGDPVGYTMWRQNFGNPPGGGGNSESQGPVPEPATALIVVLAITGLPAIGIRWRVTP